MNFKKILGFIKKQKNELISEEIRKEIGFSQESLNVIKQVTDSSIQPFYATDSKSKIAGVSFVTFEDYAEQQVIKLQSEVQKLGYLAFICERSFSQGSKSECRIAIIQGNGQFDILTIQQTNGVNYEVSNKDVIFKLRKWNDRYPFIIIGADHDWVDAIFSVLPTDEEMQSFAQEMYEFCPDIAEQGTESIEELVAEIKKTKKLFLWWD